VDAVLAQALNLEPVALPEVAGLSADSKQAASRLNLKQ
jgi:hypothetical protein